jgi:hypothetical protein
MCSLFYFRFLHPPNLQDAPLPATYKHTYIHIQAEEQRNATHRQLLLYIPHRQLLLYIPHMQVLLYIPHRLLLALPSFFCIPTLGSALSTRRGAVISHIVGAVFCATFLSCTHCTPHIAEFPRFNAFIPRVAHTAACTIAPSRTACASHMALHTNFTAFISRTFHSVQCTSFISGIIRRTSIVPCAFLLSTLRFVHTNVCLGRL